VPEGLSDRTCLRVFMTADAVGGVWQYALDLAEGLRPHGVEVTLAVLGPAPSPDQQAAAHAAGVRLLLTGLPLEWIAGNEHEVEAAGRILGRIALPSQFDLVHLNNPALASSGSFDVPVVAVCHSCVATWWQAVRSGPLPEEFVWRTELVRRGYRGAAMLLAPTRAFASATARTYDLATVPVTVRNGRRPPNVHDRASASVVAFTAGRLWDEGKNIAVVDRAAARLSIPVLAAGPLEGPNGARIHVRHLNSLGRLTDSEIRHHLSGRPIFVSAARYEPFGLAVLEAAQAGCALVLSDIPTFRELWDGAAIFVPADDDQALARSIARLADDATLRAELGRAARRSAGSYSVEAMSAGVMDAYRAALASKTSKSPFKGAAA
jgi:glycosyltransferase involved in cell wall biosynthesis